MSPSTSERTQGVACCLVPGGGQGPEAGLLHLFLLLGCDSSCLRRFLAHLYKNSKTSENGKCFCFSGASKLHSDLLSSHLGARYTLWVTGILIMVDGMLTLSGEVLNSDCHKLGWNFSQEGRFVLCPILCETCHVSVVMQALCFIKDSAFFLRQNYA